MRHPILRILVAILIGFWSPLCCCQASELLGAPCAPSQQVQEEHCCSGCDSEDSVPAQPQDSGEPCTDCHGSFAQAGVIPTFEHGGPQSCAAIVPPAAVYQVLSLLVVDAVEQRHSDPPPPRPAGRALLRWHCALVV